MASYAVQVVSGRVCFIAGTLVLTAAGYKPIEEIQIGDLVLAYDEETGEKTYQEISDGQTVTMGGMISSFKKLATKSGMMMAFVTVEDMYGSIECVCFPKTYDKIKSFLAPDVVVSLSGKIDIPDDKPPTIMVDRMTEFTLDENGAPQAEQAQVAQNPAQTEEKEKRLWLNITSLPEADLDELCEVLSNYAGDTEVCFVDKKTGKRYKIDQKVKVSRGLLSELSSFLPDECVKFL